MARSALRVDDQEADRLPDRCVLSGVETDRAVRAIAVQWAGRRWLLGVPGAVHIIGVLPGHRRMSVALPVSPAVWTTWNRRNLVALLLLMFGIGLIAASAARQTGDLFGVGLFVAATAAGYRTRAHHNYWTTCRLNAGGDTIIVEPTHPEFDRQAQRLFVRSFGGSTR